MKSRIQVITKWNELSRLEALWRDLCAKDSAATLFQSYELNYLAARIFAPRQQLYVVAAETSAGAAIVPACIRGDRITFLGDELFDYPAVLSSGSEALKIGLHELARLTIPFFVRGLRNPHSIWRNFPREPFSGAPYISRGTSADELEAAHPRLSRQLRRLERAGAVARCYSGRQNALIEKIYSLKSGQTKSFGENLFRDPLRRAFLCEALALPIMQTRIFTLETTHSLVAAVVSFRDRDIRRFYTTYFDQNWAKFSPGQALLFKAALSSLREGLTCDFMTGEQQYKLRLADEVVPLYQLGPISLDVLIGTEEATAANTHKSFRNVLAA